MHAHGPSDKRGCTTLRLRCDTCSQKPPCGMITHRIWAGFGKANAWGDRPGETRNFPETEPVIAYARIPLIGRDRSDFVSIYG
jgi:hypothetical protein